MILQRIFWRQFRTGAERTPRTFNSPAAILQCGIHFIVVNFAAGGFECFSENCDIVGREGVADVEELEGDVQVLQ